MAKQYDKRSKTPTRTFRSQIRRKMELDLMRIGYTDAAAKKMVTELLEVTKPKPRPLLKRKK